MRKPKVETQPEPNPWEGVIFFPDAPPSRKFLLTFPDATKILKLGYFATLDEAVAARERYVEYHTSTQMRETATHPQCYETRESHA